MFDDAVGTDSPPAREQRRPGFGVQEQACAALTPPPLSCSARRPSRRVAATSLPRLRPAAVAGGVPDGKAHERNVSVLNAAKGGQILFARSMLFQPYVVGVDLSLRAIPLRTISTFWGKNNWNYCGIIFSAAKEDMFSTGVRREQRQASSVFDRGRACLTLAAASQNDVKMYSAVMGGTVTLGGLTSSSLEASAKEPSRSCTLIFRACDSTLCCWCWASISLPWSIVYCSYSACACNAKAVLLSLLKLPWET